MSKSTISTFQLFESAEIVPSRASKLAPMEAPDWFLIGIVTAMLLIALLQVATLAARVAGRRRRFVNRPTPKRKRI